MANASSVLLIELYRIETLEPVALSVRQRQLLIELYRIETTEGGRGGDRLGKLLIELYRIETKVNLRLSNFSIFF